MPILRRTVPAILLPMNIASSTPTSVKVRVIWRLFAHCRLRDIILRWWGWGGVARGADHVSCAAATSAVLGPVGLASHAFTYDAGVNVGGIVVAYVAGAWGTLVAHIVFGTCCRRHARTSASGGVNVAHFNIICARNCSSTLFIRVVIVVCVIGDALSRLQRNTRFCER